jgi:hypothetical protein
MGILDGGFLPKTATPILFKSHEQKCLKNGVLATLFPNSFWVAQRNECFLDGKSNYMLGSDKHHGY